MANVFLFLSFGTVFRGLRVAVCTVMFFFPSPVFSQSGCFVPEEFTWNTQSESSAQSMPCGGGDIGLNVWVEKDDLFFYIARSGTYDENNALVKLGRVRLTLSPNPFRNGGFRQTLCLADGSVRIEAQSGMVSVSIRIWVDVFSPVVHVELNSSTAVSALLGYENWRFKNSRKTGLENNENGYKFGAEFPVKAWRDSVAFEKAGILFYHRNKPGENIFDETVRQQGLEKEKGNMFNPIRHLVFGGWLSGAGMRPAGSYSGQYQQTAFRGWGLKSVQPRRVFHFTAALLTLQTPALNKWKKKVFQQGFSSRISAASRAATVKWWQKFWNRSFIDIAASQRDTASFAWQSGRNYQLFRYMLACNVYGNYPTKFNGGLFTYDPVLVDTAYPYSPDFRNWGGSLFTAQNQRLVYYPLLKSGDFDVMIPAFHFYTRILHNAQIATRKYWNHGGARFPEQIENFGLSDFAEFGVHRPPSLDLGVDDNRWLEYHWETVLEFCFMMLEWSDYSGKSIRPYVLFIENCIEFFDQHYRYLARLRGNAPLDAAGKLVLFPGSAGETFKMATNSTPTVAGLNTVISRLLSSGTANLTKAERAKFTRIRASIPAISYQTRYGPVTIAPALSWSRISNEESPQLYPVFPYGIFGPGRPGLDTALQTFKYDSTVIKFRSYVGWKQDNIVAASLGLTEQAAALTFAKLKNSGRRFPAFWGPGFDWTPDHNWGGSGMTGLQQMLLQSSGQKIYLLPAWPGNIDVRFKLWAPGQTTVECDYSGGVIRKLIVTPKTRQKDVVLPSFPVQ